MSERNDAINLRDREDKCVCDALRGEAGLEVSSIYDLVNTSIPYPKAIPVLLRLLPDVTDERIKEGVVRALTIKEARGIAAKPLIREFIQIPGYDPTSSLSVILKWAIANALSVVADDSVFEEIAELVRDKRHGKAREMLAVAMGNMKDTQAVDVLIELMNDDEVAGHAIIALGKLKALRTRPYIERFLNHPKAWIRKEAKRALEKIDKTK